MQLVAVFARTMLHENKEINALLHLIDDPDKEVYDMVSNRILSYGRAILPNLEHLWENTSDAATQERIELLIHRVHVQDLQQDVLHWTQQAHPDLLGGLLLCSRYQYPEKDWTKQIALLQKVRRSIWLELNPFLTALEQVNVLGSIYFNYHRFKATEVNYSKPDEFLITTLLESKKGNALSNGLLLLVLAQMLDMNLHMIAIPRQVILAYCNYLPAPFEQMYPPEHIQFYVDAASGQIYSNDDVETYFKRVGVTPRESFFTPLNNRQVVQTLLRELSKCFSAPEQQYKRDELLELAALLNEPYME
ncbi:MAG: transglutaminase family protein [Lacibacter sp.]